MTLDIPVCACGLPMMEIKEGCGIFACPNDDTVQPAEIGDGAQPRVKTVRDVHFAMEWARRVKQYYPDEGRAAA